MAAVERHRVGMAPTSFKPFGKYSGKFKTADRFGAATKTGPSILSIRIRPVVYEGLKLAAQREVAEEIIDAPSRRSEWG